MSLVKHKQRSKLNQWLLNENRPTSGHHQTHACWQVMCLAVTLSVRKSAKPSKV